MEDVRDLLAEFNPEMLFADGFDEALIGYGERIGMCVAVYDAYKCIDILIERDGMTDEEAWEFFEFNISGAYMGEHTPIFCFIKERL